MGKSIKGTRTEKNLMVSFAGESQARMRYTYLSSTYKCNFLGADNKQ